MTRRSRERDAGAPVEEILGERLDAFEHWCAALAREPSEEPVHEVRVATRRLLAALVLFRPLLELPEDVDPDVLHRVERRLGRLRDLDVLTVRIRTEPAVDEAAGQGAIARLEATIAAARNQALKRATTEIERKRLQRLVSGLSAWLEHPDCTPMACLPLSLLAPDLLLPVLSSTLLHPGWQVLDAPAPDSEAALPLHALRRQMKGLRYAVECLTEWYGEPAETWINELHAIQDALGAWHDEGLLLKRLREVQGSAGLRAEALGRAREALRHWPAWRARYLDAETRVGFRRLLEGASETAAEAGSR